MKKVRKRALRQLNKRLSAFTRLREIYPDLPDDMFKAIAEARRRCGFAEKAIKVSHSSVMAHFNILFSKLKHKPERLPRIRKPGRTIAECASDEFLNSYEWRRLRYEVLIERGRRCDCCGRTPLDGIQIHVDHIQPRKKFPQLALDKANLQVLCHECNHGKGNWDMTDWRKPA